MTSLTFDEPVILYYIVKRSIGKQRVLMPYIIIQIYPTMHIHLGVADFFGTGGGDPPTSFGRGGIGLDLR